MKKMSWLLKMALMLGLFSCQEPLDYETDSDSLVGVPADCTGFDIASELTPGTINEEGVAPELVSKAQECGFQVVAFNDASQMSEDWAEARISPEVVEEHQIAASDGYLVLAVRSLRTDLTRKFKLLIDDRRLCATYTVELVWGLLDASGGLNRLADFQQTITAFEQSRADLCRLITIEVEGIAGADKHFYPNLELRQADGYPVIKTGHGRLSQRATSQGFLVQMPASMFKQGIEYKLTFYGASVPVGGVCTRIFAKTTFTDTGDEHLSFPMQLTAESTNDRDPESCTGIIGSSYLDFFADDILYIPITGNELDCDYCSVPGLED